MNKETLDDLKAKATALQKEARDAMDRYEEEMENDRLPFLKKKFLNTYWRYNNGYSLEERWFLYIHITDVLASDEFLVNSIEDDSIRVSIKISDVTGPYLFDNAIKITKGSFDKTVSKILNSHGLGVEALIL